MIDRTITRANSNEDLRNMVCKSTGMYGFLGTSWVLITTSILNNTGTASIFRL